MFKIKDRYRLELEVPERIRLFGSTKKLRDKSKNWEEVQIMLKYYIHLCPINLMPCFWEFITQGLMIS